MCPYIMEEEKWTQDDKMKCYKYYCECCDFNTTRKSAWEIHLKTKKHERNISGVGKKDTNNTKKSKSYTCGCGKSYYDHSGLYKHKKKCNGIPIQSLIEAVPVPVEKDIKDEKIDKLTEQVGILTSALTTAIKEGKLGNTTNNTTNNNTTNNTTFNLNVFLNETCKDAMNITDFVEQIKLQLSDLEYQGSNGYVGGISNILIKNLDEIDIEKRPIHCTDGKRETLYVKNNDEWVKGEEGKNHVKNAVDTIARNQIKQIGEWRKQNPESKTIHTPKSDQLMKIANSIGGGINSEEQNKNIDKVIRNVAKGTVIDKDLITNID